MKKPRRKDLRQWRPFLPNQEIRTLWRNDLRAWVTERRWKGETIFSERLSLPRFAGPTRVALEELLSANEAAPPLSSNGVFVDVFSFWSVCIPCDLCEGFSWRLPLRREKTTGYRGQLEAQMARLLGHRTKIHFSETKECPGCFDQRILEDDAELHGRSFYWYSVRYQDWHFRYSRGEEYTDYPLGLPSWASRESLQLRIHEIVPRREIFDWKKE